MNIYIDNEQVEINNIIFTNFSDVIKTYSVLAKDNKLNFNIIKELKGNKELLQKSFKDELYEQVLK